MKFEIYKDVKGEWRWRLKARNGKIIAVSGEGYKRKRSVDDTINTIRKMHWTHSKVIEVKK